MSLVLRHVSHRFGGVSAVEGASFEAAPGEILCLFGPSGCGKTTLLRIAAGLEPLQEGEVELSGELLAKPGRETPPEMRPIGLVFQDFVLFPHMTVEENVAFGVNGMRDGKSRVKAQLDALDLGVLAKRYPHQLSGGQQQRTALARALAREPKALLLDEPFASIDTALRRRLREELRRVLKDQHVSVVMVTHDPEEALALGDRIALMRAGKIVETAPPQVLFDNPQTPEGAAIYPGSQSLEGTITSGKLETAFGTFEARGLEDGAGFAVLREGAVRLEPEEGARWSVDDCRFTGPAWTAWIGAANSADRIRVMTDRPMPKGAPVRLNVDPAGVFVFRNQ